MQLGITKNFCETQSLFKNLENCRKLEIHKTFASNRRSGNCHKKRRQQQEQQKSNAL